MMTEKKVPYSSSSRNLELKTPFPYTVISQQEAATGI